MPRNRFVLPNITRLDISEGDWIEVKERLSYGEEQSLASASLTTINFNTERAEAGDTEIGLDMKRHAVLRLLTYIVDWSFQDVNGKVLPVTRSNIENLQPDTADEVNSVLDEHVKETEGKEPTRIIEAGFVAS